MVTSTISSFNIVEICLASMLYMVFIKLGIQNDKQIYNIILDIQRKQKHTVFTFVCVNLCAFSVID